MDDGPCAVPQGSEMTEITDSISDPLFNIGMMLISISLFLAMSFYSEQLQSTVNNRRSSKDLDRMYAPVINYIHKTQRRRHQRRKKRQACIQLASPTPPLPPSPPIPVPPILGPPFRPPLLPVPVPVPINPRIPGIPVDCVWSEWTDWGACSATCNGGTQDRVRVKTMEQSLGGRPCTGFNIEFQPCMTDACPEFLLVESGSHCHHITTTSECERAARALGLPDTTVEDDAQTGSTVDPPYCYNWHERADPSNQILKFNTGGTNTGECLAIDQCLCYGAAEPGPVMMAANVLQSTNTLDSNYSPK